MAAKLLPLLILCWLAALAPTAEANAPGGVANVPAGPNIAGGDVTRAALAQRRLWLMHRDGSGQHQLTNDPSYRDERPRWSADGQELLFAWLDNQTGQSSLWLPDLSGSRPVEVAGNLTLNDPDPAANWFGYYGHLNWDDAFAYWPGEPARPAGAETQASAAVPSGLPATGAGGSVSSSGGQGVLGGTTAVEVPAVSWRWPARLVVLASIAANLAGLLLLARSRRPAR